MSKCIKCGRELTSAEIPEFYNGMCEKCSRELNCAEYPFKQGIYDYQKQIDQLKHQLAEKETLIKGYQDEEKLIAKILGDERLTIIGSRVHLENLIVEFRNKIRDKDLIIEEKDKEIEDCKRNELYEENMKILAVKNQTQLAISELEKVKDWLEPKYFDYEQINYLSKIIDQQIKELKGE